MQAKETPLQKLIVLNSNEGDKISKSELELFSIPFSPDDDNIKTMDSTLIKNRERDSIFVCPMSDYKRYVRYNEEDIKNIFPYHDNKANDYTDRLLLDNAEELIGHLKNAYQNGCNIVFPEILTEEEINKKYGAETDGNFFERDGHEILRLLFNDVKNTKITGQKDINSAGRAMDEYINATQKFYNAVADGISYNNYDDNTPAADTGRADSVSTRSSSSTEYDDTVDVGNKDRLNNDGFGNDGLSNYGLDDNVVNNNYPEAPAAIHPKAEYDTIAPKDEPVVGSYDRHIYQNSPPPEDHYTMDPNPSGGASSANADAETGEQDLLDALNGVAADVNLGGRSTGASAGAGAPSGAGAGAPSGSGGGSAGSGSGAGGATATAAANPTARSTDGEATIPQATRASVPNRQDSYDDYSASPPQQAANVGIMQSGRVRLPERVTNYGDDSTMPTQRISRGADVKPTRYTNYQNSKDEAKIEDMPYNDSRSFRHYGSQLQPYMKQIFRSERLYKPCVYNLGKDTPSASLEGAAPTVVYGYIAKGKHPGWGPAYDNVSGPDKFAAMRERIAARAKAPKPRAKPKPAPKSKKPDVYSSLVRTRYSDGKKMRADKIITVNNSKINSVADKKGASHDLAYNIIDKAMRAVAKKNGGINENEIIIFTYAFTKTMRDYSLRPDHVLDKGKDAGFSAWSGNDDFQELLFDNLAEFDINPKTRQGGKDRIMKTMKDLSTQVQLTSKGCFKTAEGRRAGGSHQGARFYRVAKAAKMEPPTKSSNGRYSHPSISSGLSY